MRSGDHGWGTIDVDLEEVLIDSFANRQRMWAVEAKLFTPEKKDQPRKKRARRHRQRHRRHRPANEE